MTDLLTTISVIFVLAGPFLLLANHLDLPTVPALILAGLVAGQFTQQTPTLELAQYGIALLVFTFSANLQLSAVQRVFADSETTALGQMLVVGALGSGAGLALGIPPAEAIYLGIAAALSSTIVGEALIRSDIHRNLVRGRLATSIHLVQDLVAVLVVLVVGAEVLVADAIAQQLGYGVMLLVVAILVNRLAFDVVDRLAGDSEELMLVGVVSLLVGFVGAAQVAGVSIVVGAFAAGLAIRYDPADHLGLFNGLASIKDFFAALFFVTVGALVTLPGGAVLLTAFVLVVLTAVIKPAVTTAILLWQGYEARSATLTSLGLDQVSEFSLIIAIEALVLGLLSQSVFDAIILAAAVTMVTSSFSRRHDEAIYRTLADRGLLPQRHGKIDAWSNAPGDIDGHVIIVGYGRQGQRLVETCEAVGQDYVVVENDPALLDTLRADCEAHVFGDAMEQLTWERARTESARLVVSTVDSEPVSRRLLAFEFEADIVVRASETSTALDLLESGALYVVVSDLLAGERLVEYIEALVAGDLTPAELREERLADLRGDASTETQRRGGDVEARR